MSVCPPALTTTTIHCVVRVRKVIKNGSSRNRVVSAVERMNEDYETGANALPLSTNVGIKPWVRFS